MIVRSHFRKVKGRRILVRRHRRKRRRNPQVEQQLFREDVKKIRNTFVEDIEKGMSWDEAVKKAQRDRISFAKLKKSRERIPNKQRSTSFGFFVEKPTSSKEKRLQERALQILHSTDPLKIKLREIDKEKILKSLYRSDPEHRRKQRRYMRQYNWIKSGRVINEPTAKSWARLDLKKIGGIYSSLQSLV